MKNDTAQSAWDKIQSKYAGNTIINKTGALNPLLKTKLLENVDIGNHISPHESQFPKMGSMASNIEKQLKIAILINSLSQKTAYSAVITSRKQKMKKQLHGTMSQLASSTKRSEHKQI